MPRGKNVTVQRRPRENESSGTKEDNVTDTNSPLSKKPRRYKNKTHAWRKIARSQKRQNQPILKKATVRAQISETLSHFPTNMRVTRRARVIAQKFVEHQLVNLCTEAFVYTTHANRQKLSEKDMQLAEWRNSKGFL